MSSQEKRPGYQYALTVLVGAILLVAIVRDMTLNGVMPPDLSEALFIGMSTTIGITLVILGTRGVSRSMG
jgi:hypothetical protein